MSLDNVNNNFAQFRFHHLAYNFLHENSMVKIAYITLTGFDINVVSDELLRIDGTICTPTKDRRHLNNILLRSRSTSDKQITKYEINLIGRPASKLELRQRWWIRNLKSNEKHTIVAEPVSYIKNNDLVNTTVL